MAALDERQGCPGRSFGCELDGFLCPAEVAVEEQERVAVRGCFDGRRQVVGLGLAGV